MRLEEFAFLPPQFDWKEQIARRAVRENWGENLTYMHDYCNANFEIAYDQGQVYIDPEERFAVWRVGHLVTNDGTPIYVYFERNRLEGRQPFVFKTVLYTHNVIIRYKSDRNGPEERIIIDNPPKEPEYQIPEYRGDYKIEYNWDHFLQEHKSRIEERLTEVSKNERVLYLSIFGSTELAHRLHRMSAVPQYYRGRYQYLLPLYITHDDHTRRPDLVATLDEDEDRNVYVVKTLLPPEWAYPNARCIATNISQFRSWVADTYDEQ